MRLMYDSTTPWSIPRDAEMVAYYVDGRYAWPSEWLDLFPNAVKVGISAVGARGAQVGDVETGCIWPPENAVPWVLQARSEGYDPTIYVNERNDWSPTILAFLAAGVPAPHWWVAHYDGVRDLPTGAVAKQFAHPGDGGPSVPWETGAHYDLSVVADYWPGVDLIAHPGDGGGQPKPPKRKRKSVPNIKILRTTGGPASGSRPEYPHGFTVECLWSGGRFRHSYAGIISDADWSVRGPGYADLGILAETVDVITFFNALTGLWSDSPIASTVDIVGDAIGKV